jgi:hypothetical protein
MSCPTPNRRLPLSTVLACLIGVASIGCGDAHRATVVSGPPPPAIVHRGELLADATREWSLHYANAQLAFEADALGDVATEMAICEQLLPRLDTGDPRIAETYDTLGLYWFMSGDYTRCEACQGKAATLALLSHGPDGEIFIKYVERLGRVYSCTQNANAERIRESAYWLLDLGYIEPTHAHLDQARKLLDRCQATDTRSRALISRFLSMATDV